MLFVDVWCPCVSAIVCSFFACCLFAVWLLLVVVFICLLVGRWFDVCLTIVSCLFVVCLLLV